MNQMPETRLELRKSMQNKAHSVQKFMSTQALWSLVNADMYTQFYLDCQQPETKKKVQQDEEAVEESNDFSAINNEKSAEKNVHQEETKVFYRNYVA